MKNTDFSVNFTEYFDWATAKLSTDHSSIDAHSFWVDVEDKFPELDIDQAEQVAAEAFDCFQEGQCEHAEWLEDQDVPQHISDGWAMDDKMEMYRNEY